VCSIKWFLKVFAEVHFIFSSEKRTMNKILFTFVLFALFTVAFSATVCETCIGACNISPADASNCIARCRNNLSGCPAVRTGNTVSNGDMMKEISPLISLVMTAAALFFGH
jgi:hypothetical protein